MPAGKATAPELLRSSFDKRLAEHWQVGGFMDRLQSNHYLSLRVGVGTIAVGDA